MRRENVLEPIKDAPVKMVSPTDGAFSTPLQILVMKNAPQPNTVKVYLTWFLGKEGQRVMSEGSASIRADVDAISQETQIIGETFLPNVPFTWDFEMTKMKEAVKVFGKWFDDLGK